VAESKRCKYARGERRASEHAQAETSEQPHVPSTRAEVCSRRGRYASASLGGLISRLPRGHERGMRKKSALGKCFDSTVSVWVSDRGKIVSVLATVQRAE